MASGGAIPNALSFDVRKEIAQISTETTQYLETLQKEIKSNESEQDNLITEISKINEKMDQITQLSDRPEWPDSFIQINSRAYISATIVHTGEHYVELSPDTYTLMSLKETLAFLQRKLDGVQKILEAFKIQKIQLEERCMFFRGEEVEVPNTETMPTEIVSNKGVAKKTPAGWYDVIELYDETDEQTFYKRRRENIRKKQTNEESNVFFDRLDELQKQEDSLSELDISEHSERIRVILRQSGFYKDLLEDNVIQRHCHRNQTESALYELIVKALINEPIAHLNYTETNEDLNIKSELDFISSNDLATSTFLDSIEDDV